MLVTGAGGFIGSHLCERLIGLGARVRALVHYNALGTWGWLDHSPLARDMEVTAGDVRDRETVEAAISGVEIVFHLAALIAIPYSYQAPLSYLRTNAEGTVNVLSAARRAGVERVVHTSTSEVYGTARYVPIDEGHPLQAQSPYAASKIAADKFAESFYLSFGFPVVTVRPFNTYGPRQSARAVIPTIISQALFRKEIRLGNLSPTRDFNFVSDTVEGFVKAAEAPEVAGRVINIGSGREVSIGETVGLVREILGTEIPIVTEEERVRPQGSEVERLLASNERAARWLNWHPLVGLGEGLEKTVEWIRENEGRFRPGCYSI